MSAKEDQEMTTTFNYKGWTLSDAMLALHAYDSGYTDSGTRDDLMLDSVVTYLRSLDENAFRVELSAIVRDAFLSDAAIAEGYGVEDVARFLEWLADCGIAL
jgi:hypothetical protein